MLSAVGTYSHCVGIIMSWIRAIRFAKYAWNGPICIIQERMIVESVQRWVSAWLTSIYNNFNSDWTSAINSARINVSQNSSSGIVVARSRTIRDIKVNKWDLNGRLVIWIGCKCMLQIPIGRHHKTHEWNTRGVDNSSFCSEWWNLFQ